MPNQTALERKPESSSERPFIVEAEKLLDRMRELKQSIKRRAHEFFEARGGDLGHALDDWFRAESEMLRPVPVQISATEKRLTVLAELPGFKSDEIKVSVEANRLIISGESQSKVEKQTEQTIYNERRSRQFFRALAMPADVDPEKRRRYSQRRRARSDVGQGRERAGGRSRSQDDTIVHAEIARLRHVSELTTKP